MKKYITVLSIFLCSNLVVGQAKEVAIAVLLDELETKARSIIADAKYVFDSSVNNAAANVLNSIQQFKDAYSDVLQKTSKELVGQQEMAWDGLEKSINLIFYRIEKEHDKIDDSIDNLALHLGHTLLGDKIPRITRFSSPIVVRNIGNQYELAFEGVFLNNMENYLEINKTHYKPQELTDKSLKFLIPTQEFNNKNQGNAEQIMYQGLILKCFYKKGFLFIKNTMNKEYKYLVKSLPDKVGTFVVHYRTKDVKKVENQRAEKLEARCKSSYSGSRGKSDVSKIFVPQNGYMIDINSINIVDNKSGDCSGDKCTFDRKNVASSALQVDIHAETQKNPKVNCTYTVYVNFKEYKQIDELLEKNTQEQELLFSTPQTVALPNNTENFLYLSLKLFTGTEIVFDKGGIQEFAQMNYNAVTRLVTLRAKL